MLEKRLLSDAQHVICTLLDKIFHFVLDTERMFSRAPSTELRIDPHTPLGFICVIGRVHWLLIKQLPEEGTRRRERGAKHTPSFILICSPH